MEGLLTQKTAVITGAGSGVGRAACRIFAEHGARVIAADVDEDAVRETAKEVSQAGGTIVDCRCDVTDAAEVAALVGFAVANFGLLDIMYNNAGITVPPEPGKGLRRLVETDDDLIRKVFAVNIDGVINGCKAAIRQFEAQGSGGVIVNTNSIAGLIGYGGVAYNASKGAVTMLTRSLALEVAAAGIRINSVCPAGMVTNFMPGLAASATAKERMGAAHPLGRAIEPEECANAALFLASDLASNITGVNLPVDGGLSAGIPPRR